MKVGLRRWRSMARWLGIVAVGVLGAAGARAPVPPASWAQARTAPEPAPEARPEAKPDEAKVGASKSDKPKPQTAKEADAVPGLERRELTRALDLDRYPPG